MCNVVLSLQTIARSKPTTKTSKRRDCLRPVYSSNPPPSLKREDLPYQKSQEREDGKIAEG